MDTLPAVAKNFYYHCSKCGTDRYHKVLAHLSKTEAKLECEVCHSKKKYSLVPKKTVTVRKTTGASSTTRSTGGASRGHDSTYQGLMEKWGGQPPQAYSINERFELHQLVSHPTFGLGVVTLVGAQKIDVCFSEAVKTLMHLKKS